MNRYSFNGKGNILIKAGVSAVYGGKSYLANEPIAYFTDVIISLDFSNSDKIASRGIENLTSDSKSEPSILRVQNIKSSESLLSLLYKKQTNNTKNKTVIKSLSSEDGSLFIPIQSEQTLNSEIFIYNSNKVLMSEYEVSEDGVVSGLPDGQYTIFYSINSIANSTFSLETPSLPNMKIELSVVGNLNGQGGEVVLHLNNVKMLSRPILDFVDESPFVETLEFVVQKDRSPVEVNYYG